jgi:CRP-like cAMP-binding protein
MGYATTSRRTSEARAIADFFALHGLPPYSADALTEVSRLRRRNRGRPLVLPVSKSAFFLVDGRVSELVQPGKVRLWRELMLFENISSTAFFPGTYGEERVSTNSKSMISGSTLSRCVFVEVPNSKLNSLATTDPAIALMLARMAAKRHVLTERLYTASRATPAARVAAVLNYLAEPTRRNVIRPRSEDGVLVMTTAEELVASGPSQADLADALCLGRATVEKAIAELRQLKALRSFGPGERANRCYPIEDRELLRGIALGG